MAPLAVEYTEVVPPPPLDRLVHSVWFLRGDLAGGQPETIVPDARMEIVLHLGEPFAEVGPNGAVCPQRDALVAGQLTAPLRLVARGPADIVGIKFRSAGLGGILGLPLSELAGRTAPLAELHPVLAGSLLSAAASSPRPGARAEAVARALGRFVERGADPRVEAACRLLDAPHAPRVRAVAERLGLSTRTLERKLLDEVGLSPKTLQRVLRFRRAFRLLDRTPAGQWASAAAVAGYFDQAHLIREFRDFAGAPPSVFFGADPELARTFVGADDPQA